MNDTGLWRSSLPIQGSNLADDGFVAEIDTEPAPKEREPVVKDKISTTQQEKDVVTTNTDAISTTVTTTPKRTSTNVPTIIVTPNTDTEKRKSTPDTSSRFICQPVKVAKVLFKQTYKRAVHPLEKGQIVASEHMATNVLEPSKEHDNCPCNFDRSPGSMESDGML